MLSLLRDLGFPEEVHFQDGVERVQIELGEPSVVASNRSSVQLGGRRQQHAVSAD
jgi:hypothetical protein